MQQQRAYQVMTRCISRTHPRLQCCHVSPLRAYYMTCLYQASTITRTWRCELNARKQSDCSARLVFTQLRSLHHDRHTHPRSLRNLIRLVAFCFPASCVGSVLRVFKAGRLRTNRPPSARCLQRFVIPLPSANEPHSVVFGNKKCRLYCFSTSQDQNV